MALSHDYLGLSYRQLAVKLQYADPSTMRSVWHGLTLPSIEKLVLFSQLKCSPTTRPNIDWVLTGKGKPLLTLESSRDEKVDIEKLEIEGQLATRLKQMSLRKKQSLLAIID